MFKEHRNEHEFCVRTDIDLFVCLTDRDGGTSSFNNRRYYNGEEREGGGQEDGRS